MSFNKLLMKNYDNNPRLLKIIFGLKYPGRSLSACSFFLLPSGGDAALESPALATTGHGRHILVLATALSRCLPRHAMRGDAVISRRHRRR